MTTTMVAETVDPLEAVIEAIKQQIKEEKEKREGANERSEQQRRAFCIRIQSLVNDLTEILQRTLKESASFRVLLESPWPVTHLVGAGLEHASAVLRLKQLYASAPRIDIGLCIVRSKANIRVSVCNQAQSNFFREVETEELQWLMNTETVACLVGLQGTNALAATITRAICDR